jgi:hypothetical protein
MNQLNKRLNKLETGRPEIDLYDLSVLTDQELEFMEYCLKKAGAEGDLTLLSKTELNQFEEIHEKSKKQDTHS